jgi:hypothetical protein
MTTSMFNFRVEGEMLVAIEAAADAAGLAKSTWAREILGAVAIGGVTMEDLRLLVEARQEGRPVVSPHPVRHLALQGPPGRRDQVARSCVHPESGWKRLPFSIVCGVCGDTVRKTDGATRAASGQR